MQHPVDGLVGAEEFEYGLGICDVALHADAQRLDALQQLKGIGRRKARAEVAQAFGARPHDECARAEFFGEDDAVIAGIRCRQCGEFF